MDITFEYSAASRVVLCRLVGVWDWERFYAALEQHRSTAAQTEHFIIDGTAVTEINSDAVLNLKRAAAWAAESHKRYYVVASNRYLQTIYYAFIRIYQDLAPRFWLVETVEQANAMISRASDD